jgi:hypothetical protein
LICCGALILLVEIKAPYEYNKQKHCPNQDRFKINGISLNAGIYWIIYEDRANAAISLL